MTLISLFLFFVFSALGLSMLFMAQIYLKSSAYKRNSTLLSYASENGVKSGFSHLLGLLSQTDFPSPLSSQETYELRENIRTKGSKLLEKLLGSTPPLQASENWENLEWESLTDIYPEEILETEDYFHVTYRVEIQAQGKIINLKQAKESSLEIILGVFAGNIPLLSFPLLIDRDLDFHQKQDFMERNKIAIMPFERNLISPKISFSEGGLIPESAPSHLRKALKMKFFAPQRLPNALLRAVLGLEKTNKPVPDGVYLVKDDLGLGGIFVQGDIEEMVMAIDQSFQVISFLTENGRWTLRFSPSQGKTNFSTPEETSDYNLLPLGIIVVNGEIRSLGGGVKEGTERAILTQDEVPAILSGVKLTIVSSDKITLSSHLLHQGVQWLEGIPYVKTSNSELIISSTGRDFLDSGRREGKIIIDEKSPREIKIQASLSASDKGFSIEGKQKTVFLLGSLQASSYSSDDSTLKIKFNEHFLEKLEENILDMDIPITAKPVLFLSFLRPVEWKER